MLAVLSGKTKVGQRVLVVGGGVIGTQFGLFLAEQGKEVIFTTPRNTILHDIGQPRPVYEEILARQKKVTIHTNRWLHRVTDTGAVVGDGEGYWQEILAEFKPDKEYTEAFDLWVEYYLACEAYDQRVCTGLIDRYGCRMPRDTFERSLSNKHARNQEAELYQRAGAYPKKYFKRPGETFLNIPINGSKITQSVI